MLDTSHDILYNFTNKINTVFTYGKHWMGLIAITKLKTLQKALILMECFLIKDQWGVRELGKQLDMNPSIVQKILATFEEYGYIHKNCESNKYELGMKHWEFGLVVQDKLKLNTVVQSVLDRLCEEIQETIFLTKLDRTEALTIGMSESSQSIKFTVELGTRSPLHAGATSKVLMAYLTHEEKMHIISKGLQKLTPNTITNAEELLADLESICNMGWCYSVGEFDLDTAGFAVPLFDDSNKIMASLSIAAPKYRLDYEDAMKQLNTMKAGALEIQDRINRLSLIK